MNFMGVELEIDENGWLNITQAVKPFFKKADKYPTLMRCQREAQRFGVSKITEVRSAGYALQTWLHPSLVADFLDWLPSRYGKHVMQPATQNMQPNLYNPNCATQIQRSEMEDLITQMQKLESDLCRLRLKLLDVERAFLLE